MESSRSLTEKGEFAKNAESDVYLCFRVKIHYWSQLTAQHINMQISHISMQCIFMLIWSYQNIDGCVLL